MNNLTSIINEATGLKLKKSMNIRNDSEKAATQEKILKDIILNIAPKFNGIDNRLVNASKGDFNKFRYSLHLTRTIGILESLARSQGSNTQPGNQVLDVTNNAGMVISYLRDRSDKYRYYFAKGDVFITMTYTAAINALVFGLSYLIAEMVTFNEEDGDTVVELVYSPAVEKSPHIKLIKELANIYRDGTMDKIFQVAQERDMNTVNEAISKETEIVFNETVGLNEGLGISVAGSTMANIISTGIGVFPILAAVLILSPFVIWKIIPLVREVLYTVYYTRVKMEEALDLQIALLETNIEALENRKMNKKVIARQRGVVKLLNGTKSIVSVKIDDADTKALREINVENRKMGVSNDEFEESASSGLML